MTRFSAFSIYSALLLAAAVLLAAPAEQALAQEDDSQPAGSVMSLPAESPLDAPVTGGDPVLPDISSVRAAIRPVSIDSGVRIALDVHVSSRTIPDTLFFPSAGLRVDSVFVNGGMVVSSTDLGRLAVPVPADTDSTISGELRVTLFYAVLSGLNRRSDDDGPYAVWTSPGGFDAHWLPLPSASDDLFHADLAMMPRKSGARYGS